MKTVRKLIAVASLTFLSAACLPSGESAQVLDSPSVASSSANGIIRATYAAADRLLQTSQSQVNPTKPLLVTSLVDINNYENSSPFGRMVREQVMSRLVSSGYSMVEVTLRNNLLVRQGGGQFMLSRNVMDIGNERGAQAIIVGTYTVAVTDLFVNLRLIRANDGHILSAVDFAVPKDKNITAMVPPLTRHVTSGY